MSHKYGEWQVVVFTEAAAKCCCPTSEVFSICMLVG